MEVQPEVKPLCTAFFELQVVGYTGSRMPRDFKLKVM